MDARKTPHAGSVFPTNLLRSGRLARECDIEAVTRALGLYRYARFGYSTSRFLRREPTAVNMSPEEISRQYLGETVPQSYNAKFIVLSFVVSLVGASSTLELINRRTGFKGVFNQLVSIPLSKSLSCQVLTMTI